jgi:hypothetical protein
VPQDVLLNGGHVAPATQSCVSLHAPPMGTVPWKEHASDWEPGAPQPPDSMACVQAASAAFETALEAPASVCDLTRMHASTSP